MKTWEKVLYATLFFFFGAASSMFGHLTFDIQFFDYDFNDVYPSGSTRTVRFLIHFGIMARNAIALLYILRRVDWKQRTSYEFFVVVATFLYMLKECWDVIYCNNVTGSIVYEVVGLIMVLVLGYFCTHYQKSKNVSTKKRQ